MGCWSFLWPNGWCHWVYLKGKKNRSVPTRWYWKDGVGDRWFFPFETLIYNTNVIFIFLISIRVPFGQWSLDFGNFAMPTLCMAITFHKRPGITLFFGPVDHSRLDCTKKNSYHLFTFCLLPLFSQITVVNPGFEDQAADTTGAKRLVALWRQYHAKTSSGFLGRIRRQGNTRRDLLPVKIPPLRASDSG